MGHQGRGVSSVCARKRVGSVEGVNEGAGSL